MQVSDMLEYCRKELGEHTLHVAWSGEAKKTVKESDVSATSCHQYYHVLALTRFI